MTTHKFIPTLIFNLLFGLTIYLLSSCSENKSKESSSSKNIKQTTQKYDGVTIEVDISNKNWLSILLANDGTINRKGSSSFDPKDKNFFIGLTNSKAFDSLMNEIPNGLLQYCNSHSPACDTLKQTCKAKIAFGNNTSSCEIEYCVNGTIDDLPQTIKDFINKSIEVTEPWYQEQQKPLHGK
ncbi:MAG: hypothetical protein ACJ75B_09640 [Flavisolibacter sp.]|jgi:hypothetical protein